MNATNESPQLSIKKIMDDSVLSVNSTVSAFDAAKLMENSGIGAIIVLENQVPVGMVTNKDLSLKIIAHSYPTDTPLRRIMSTPLISITPDADLSTASEIMSSKKIRKLPIINGEEVIGILVASEIG